ncbi:AraC family transcriptional regulator [Methylobacterium sp. OAE515]|uniref:helix-turn-helix domain-containing protein n=1 Tax=Methylobacterium sp. OAE515 TaxID=2817895 RepID=UPI00178A98C1
MTVAMPMNAMEFRVPAFCDGKNSLPPDMHGLCGSVGREHLAKRALPSVAFEDWSDGIAFWISPANRDCPVPFGRCNAILIQAAPSMSFDVLGEVYAAHKFAEDEIRLIDMRASAFRPCAGAIHIALSHSVFEEISGGKDQLGLDLLDAFRDRFDRPLLDKAARNMILMAASTIGRSDRYSTLVRRQLARALAAHVFGTYALSSSAGERKRGGLAPWQLRRLQQRVESEPAKSLSLQTMAQDCGLSTGHFARVFRSSVGSSPRAWLIKERIKVAKQLMRQSDLSLAEIALACGFSDQSHFTRIFTRAEQVSPGRWRRLLDPEDRG